MPHFLKIIGGIVGFILIARYGGPAAAKLLRLLIPLLIGYGIYKIASSYLQRLGFGRPLPPKDSQKDLNVIDLCPKCGDLPPKKRGTCSKSPCPFQT